MNQAQKKDESHQQELGDEIFMSASALRAYMNEMQMARAAQAFEGMDLAEKARNELMKQLQEPLVLTPARLKEITHNLQTKLRRAAQDGKDELMVMRFPNSLCTDKRRAINNSDPDWPDTLTGRPRQAYELWRDQLRGAGYKLTAMIIDWPRGLPGDVGFFLHWGDQRR